eukprot:383164-Pyramimonas_sp.AAC.1
MQSRQRSARDTERRQTIRSTTCPQLQAEPNSESPSSGPRNGGREDKRRRWGKNTKMNKMMVGVSFGTAGARG